MSIARPCPACDGRSGLPAGSANGFGIVRCAACGTVFTAALPAAADAMDYGGQQSAGAAIPAFVEERLGRVVAEFEPYRSLNRWLDVGCGAGTLLRAAAGRGWAAVGTEVAPGRAEAVRATGLEVHLGELDELDLDEGGFDVVSLVEVVEHVEAPAALVQSAARLLRPGGAMYLTTPHGRGLSARMLGSGWTVVAPPEHLQLFSVKGIRALLSRAGLDTKRIRTHAVNPHELLGALRRRGGKVTTSSERKQTGYRLNESLSGNRAGAVAKSLANGTLSALRLGDTLKVTAARRA